MNPNEIKRLLEEIKLCSATSISAERIKDLETEQAHYLRFRNWLQREVRQAESGENTAVEMIKRSGRETLYEAVNRIK